jgi:hypothetical protein
MTNPTRLVRYHTVQTATAANTAAIEAVFTELHQIQSPGLSYRVYRRGNEFFHLAQVGDVTAEPDPLRTIPAFRRFLAGIRDRTTTEPASDPVQLVGAYDATVP